MTREQLLEDALDAAMTSLAAYGKHPIIEQQARKAKAFKTPRQRRRLIAELLEEETYLTLSSPRLQNLADKVSHFRSFDEVSKSLIYYQLKLVNVSDELITKLVNV